MRRRTVIVAAGLAGVLAGSGMASAVAPGDNTHARPALPAAAATALRPIAEAWYQLASVNTCSLPTGCADVPAPTTPHLPVDPSAYEAGTLHIGWAGGVETARTYLKLQRAKTATAGTVLAASLRLPVLTAPQTGTLLLDNAGIKACLVTEPFTDGVDGATSVPPAIDCSVSQPLELSGDAFTLDLAPFLAAWAKGKHDNGIALTPFTSSDPTSPWHVALPGRNFADGTAIAGILRYRPAVATTAGQPAAPTSAAGIATTPLGTVTAGAASGVIDAPAVSTDTVRHPAAPGLGRSPLTTMSTTSHVSWGAVVLGTIGLAVLGFLLVACCGGLRFDREAAT